VPADFKEEISKIARRKYELVVIGNTNVGKSTFLNQITKMKDFFNVSNNRETSCIWRFLVEPEQEMPFQSLERRLLPDTDTLQSVVHNRQQVGTVKEITDIIKTYRKPAASAGAAKEEAKIVEEDEDDDTLVEIQISMQETGAYKVISDYLTIVDMPGIEDGFKAGCIKSYVDDNVASLLPTILVNLTQGAFEELKQFEDFEKLFADPFKPVPIVFTKFYNMLNDIANKLREKGITK
jgi:septin family protein